MKYAPKTATLAEAIYRDIDKNQYLNELTEKYTGKKVVALPIEATALGNLKIQMESCPA